MTAAWRFGCKFPDGGLLRGIESILKSTKDDEIANCILERQVQVSTDILSWWFGRLCVSFSPCRWRPNLQNAGNTGPVRGELLAVLVLWYTVVPRGCFRSFHGFKKITKWAEFNVFLRWFTALISRFNIHSNAPQCDSRILTYPLLPLILLQSCHSVRCSSIRSRALNFAVLLVMSLSCSSAKTTSPAQTYSRRDRAVSKSKFVKMSTRRQTTSKTLNNRS